MSGAQVETGDLQVPGPPPDATAPDPTSTAADTGIQEAKSLSLGLSAAELKKAAAKKEYDREQRFKDHFEAIAIWSLYGLALAFFLSAVIWLWHMLAPECLHYLTPEQQSKLQALLTGGILAGAISNHMRKRLK